MRILVIEDHPAVALLLADALQTEGHQAFVAAGGEEGLQVIEQSSPDAVLLDIVMSGIDGIEVLRRIRQKRPNLPVIILSGLMTDQQMETARELGVTDVVRKPAPLRHFAAALGRVTQA